MFAVAALGVALSMCIDAARARTLRAVSPLALAAALGPALLGLGTAAVTPRASSANQLKVAVVQGGGEQRTRAVTSDSSVVFERHLAASRTITEKVDLVVWPENVVSIDQPLARSPQGQKLSELSRRLGAPLIVGVVETVSDSEFTNYSVVVVGNVIGDRYDKVQRVPFGEYVPFRAATDALSGGAASRFIPRDARAGTEPATLDSPVGRLGVVISWEVFFERRARDADRQRRHRPAQPHQRLFVLVDDRAVPAGGVLTAAGDRDRPLGGAGRTHRVLCAGRPIRPGHAAQRHRRGPCADRHGHPA